MSAFRKLLFPFSLLYGGVMVFGINFMTTEFFPLKNMNCQ